MQNQKQHGSCEVIPISLYKTNKWLSGLATSTLQPKHLIVLPMGTTFLWKVSVFATLRQIKTTLIKPNQTEQNRRCDNFPRQP